MKKKIVLITLASLFFIYLVLILIPRTNNPGIENQLVQDNEMPLLIAHGGGNLEFPDNTFEAFVNAYNVSNDFMAETDISITKDGVLILSHDTTLNRRTNIHQIDSRYFTKPANICDFTYEYLIENKVNFGYYQQKIYTNYAGEAVKPSDITYPSNLSMRDEQIYYATTLEELIKAFPNNYINVEIKQTGETGKKALKATIELFNKLESEGYPCYNRIILASFHKDIYNELISLKKDYPNLMFSPETKGVIKFYVLHLLRLDLFFLENISVLQIPTSQYGFNLATKSLIKTAHKHNISVQYWTIDDEDVMRQLIEIKADGIMTNRPTLLKQVIDEYQNK